MKTIGDRPKKKIFRFEPNSPEVLSQFLGTNKDKYDEIWIVLMKKKFADPQPVSADEALTEAIRHGLIDTRIKSLDEQKYLILLQKRKLGSHWTAKNLEILEKIKKEKDHRNNHAGTE